MNIKCFLHSRCPEVDFLDASTLQERMLDRTGSLADEGVAWNKLDMSEE